MKTLIKILSLSIFTLLLTSCEKYTDFNVEEQEEIITYDYTIPDKAYPIGIMKNWVLDYSSDSTEQDSSLNYDLSRTHYPSWWVYHKEYGILEFYDYCYIVIDSILYYFWTEEEWINYIEDTNEPFKPRKYRIEELTTTELVLSHITNRNYRWHYYLKNSRNKYHEFEPIVQDWVCISANSDNTSVYKDFNFTSLTDVSITSRDKETNEVLNVENPYCYALDTTIYTNNGTEESVLGHYVFYNLILIFKEKSEYDKYEANNKIFDINMFDPDKIYVYKSTYNGYYSKYMETHPNIKYSEVIEIMTYDEKSLYELVVRK